MFKRLCMVLKLPAMIESSIANQEDLHLIIQALLFMSIIKYSLGFSANLLSRTFFFCMKNNNPPPNVILMCSYKIKEI